MYIVVVIKSSSAITLSNLTIELTFNFNSVTVAFLKVTITEFNASLTATLWNMGLNLRKQFEITFLFHYIYNMNSYIFCIIS